MAGKASSKAATFLATFGLETGMKAYLLHKGLASLAQLRGKALRHNLLALWSFAAVSGSPFTRRKPV
jgi:hypothetical protein